MYDFFFSFSQKALPLQKYYSPQNRPMGVIDIVSASAGSGKTYNMAYRYIRTLITNPYIYRHILAVTFTNKATDELKERILEKLHKLALGENEEFEEMLLKDTELDSDTIRAHAAEARNLILHDYNNFAVMTIDKFFQRVMRAFIKELDVDLNFNLELETDSLLARAADNLLDKLSESQRSDLRSWVLDFIGEKIESGEGWDIRKGLTTLGKELFKEEYRKAQIESSDKPLLRQIVNSSFKRADTAAKQLMESAKSFIKIMDDNALVASDFKNANSSVAAYVQKIASGKIDKPSTTVLNALYKDEWYTKTSPKAHIIDSLKGDLRKALQEICDAYPQVETAENTAAILSKFYRDFALLADLQESMREICDKEETLPITDVNDLICKLISNNDTPFIYERSGNRYSHFMIDEFQDTSTVQWSNFVPLLQNAVSQSDEAPVMLVGDVKQSIYRWRGGDWSLLSHGVQRDFEEVRTSSLPYNFRSREKVVEFNNNLMVHAIGWLRQKVSTMLQEAHKSNHLSPELKDRLNEYIADAYTDFFPKSEGDIVGQKSNDKSGKGYVSITVYEEDKKDNKDKQQKAEKEEPKAESHPILARICELQDRGYRAKDIAILVRSNKEAKRIAEMLLGAKTTPGYEKYVFDVVTQEALEIGSSSTVRFMVACMRIAINPKDRISLATYNKYLHSPFEALPSEEESAWLNSLALMQPEEIFNEILLHHTQCCTPNEIPYIQAFHNQIIGYCSRKIADAALFLQWWNDCGYKEYIALPQGANAITIATIHKSKGLAYNVVLLPYCHWSTVADFRSILWASPNTPFTDKIVRFPVSPSEKLGASEFSHAYYTEQTLTSIDSLNTLYVALTRAVEELHIMVDKHRADKNSVGKIFTSYLGDSTTLEFGSPCEYTPKQAKQSQPSLFSTYSPKGKLAVSYNHQRYDEDSSGELLSPRDMGTLMHKVFEESATLADAERRIGELAGSGEISDSDAVTLRSNLSRAMTNDEVKGWFDGSWEEVFVEREIIADGRFHRPDRVMVRGGEAVVMDYKFGLNQSDKHIEQIKLYASLLRQMGYESVRGYLWYLSIGEVNRVV